MERPRDEIGESSLAPGDVVGRYVVLEPRGRGAMGAVYAAYDPELGRRVALKVVRTEAAARQGSQVARERLLREAQALARLAHPNVVRVFDVGATDAGLFLAMELVEGGDLRAWLTERRDVGEVLEGLLQAGRGLQAAHALGLVHRDFKPDNVLVAPDGRVRVADFGLARRYDDPAEEPTEAVRLADAGPRLGLTASGAAVGTPRYMAPEQHEGHEAEPRSDQYAFCLTLYEALYGRRPFEGEDGEALAERKRRAELDLAARGRAGRIPASVRAALRRGLAPSPDDRFASMEPLLAALGRARARAGVVRGIAAVGVVAVLGGATVAGAQALRGDTTACSQAGVPPDEAWGDEAHRAVRRQLADLRPAAEVERSIAALDRTVERWSAAHRSACEDTWIRGEQSPARLDARMGCLREQWRELAATVTLLRDADAATAERSVELVLGLPVAARCDEVRPPRVVTPDPGAEAVNAGLAEVAALRRAARYDEAWQRLQALGEPGPDAPATASTAALWLARGQVLADRGALVDSEQTYHRALAVARAAGDAIAEADAWLSLADAASERQHDPERTRFYAGMGVAAAQAVGGDDRIESWAETMLGSLAFVEGDDERAAEHWERALALREAAFGAEHPLTAASLNNLGGVRYGQGAYADAEALIRRGLEIRERMFGPDHPDVASSATNLGLVLVAAGRSAEAVGWHERALTIQRARLGDEHPALIRTHDGLAQALREAGRDAEAREHFEHARELVGQHLPPQHPALVSVLQGLAEIDLAQGEPERARREVEQAVAIVVDDSFDPHTRADVHWLHARVLAALGRPDEARRAARLARERAGEAGAEASSLSAEIDAWLGTVGREASSP